MIEQVTMAWRARRVLLVGQPDVMTLHMESLLFALGARAARIPTNAKAHTLCSALSSGRISALIVPSAHALADANDLFSQLHALHLLLKEAQEAGVPLVVLCSHEDVYAPAANQWQTSEAAPLGGKTREGLNQSILQLYADGFSRGLLGDAVTVVICRHTPCLGSDHPCVAQYSAWCRALLHSEAPIIEHPGAQGAFLHPLDAALGALCLAARFYTGETDCAGAFNIAPTALGLCANRSACLHLMQENGCTRTAREVFPPRRPAPPVLDATLAKNLCGFSALLDAKEALSFLMRHERALAVGKDAAYLQIKALTQDYLDKLI